MLSEFKTALISIRAGWNRSSIKPLLNISDMGSFFQASAEEPGNCYEFLKIYLSSSWIFKVWFKSFILNQSELFFFELIVEFFSELDATSLLAISREDRLEPVFNALVTLKNEAMFDENYITIIAHHEKPEEIAKAIIRLKKLGLQSKDNQEAIINHARPLALVQAFAYLDKAELLTKSIRQYCAYHPKPELLAKGIVDLHKNNLLTSENLKAISEHANPFDLARGLNQLNSAFLLFRENRLALIQHPCPHTVAQELINLNNHRLLSPSTRLDIVNHPTPLALSNVLVTLHRAKLLSPHNHLLAVNHARPRDVANALLRLSEARILNQTHFLQLFEPRNSFLLSHFCQLYIFDRLPPHRLAHNWQLILRMAQGDHPATALTRFIYPNIGLFNAPRPAAANEFNPGQSTHTQSIHKSVSQSSKKLFSRYAAQIKIEPLIKSIQDYIFSLSDDSLIYRAAKRCMMRISGPEYNFTDHESQISTKQLLALSWLAMHDDENRKGSLIDAQKLFVEGLYEIQRCYNLDEKNIDKGGSDKPSCPAGVFNKIIEKLAGIHTDCSLIYITEAQAALKLPIVVKEEVHAYLKSLQAIKRIQMLLQLKNEGVACIWKDINKKIFKRMFDEFSSLYPEENANEKIAQLTQIGQDVDISSVLALYSQPAPFFSQTKLVYKKEPAQTIAKIHPK